MDLNPIPDTHIFQEMIKFIASEYQSGTKLYGCLDRQALVPYLRSQRGSQLEDTQPLS